MRYNKTSIRDLLRDYKHGEFVIKWAFTYGMIDGDSVVEKPQQIKIIRKDWCGSYYLKFQFFDLDAQSTLNYLDDELSKYLHIFDEEDECINAYNDNVWEDIKNYEFYAMEYQKKADNMKETAFIKSDYIIEKLRRSS